MTVPALMFAAGLSLLPRPAAAQMVTLVGSDRVTVRAQNVPIATLLAELAPLAAMDRMEVDPLDQSRTVTVAVDDVTARVAILIALRSSGVDFIFTEKRLRVGAGGKVIETPRRQPAGVVDRDRDVVAVAPRPVAPRPTAEPIDDPRDGIRGAQADSGAGSAGSSAGNASQTDVTPQPTSVVSEFDHGLSVRDVPFVVKEDSAIVTEPGFVPYKNRPDVKRLRMTIDPATIP